MLGLSSIRNNFFAGLEFYLITKRLVKAQHKILVEKIRTFDGTVNKSLGENTTHIICPRSVTYKAALAALDISTRLIIKDTVPFVNIDWLPACIAQRKLVPITNFEVSIIYPYTSLRITACIHVVCCRLTGYKTLLYMITFLRLLTHYDV